MSQHNFDTEHNGRPVRVLMGYDRRLNYVFMVIESLGARPAEDSEKDDYVYSNMNEGEPFGMTLDEFRDVLKGLALTVPEQMFEQVQLDQSNAVGNRVVWYEADGRFKEGPDAT